MKITAWLYDIKKNIRINVSLYIEYWKYFLKIL